MGFITMPAARIGTQFYDGKGPSRRKYVLARLADNNVYATPTSGYSTAEQFWPLNKWREMTGLEIDAALLAAMPVTPPPPPPAPKTATKPAKATKATKAPKTPKATVAPPAPAQAGPYVPAEPIVVCNATDEMYAAANNSSSADKQKGKMGKPFQHDGKYWYSLGQHQNGVILCKRIYPTGEEPDLSAFPKEQQGPDHGVGRTLATRGKTYVQGVETLRITKMTAEQLATDDAKLVARLTGRATPAPAMPMAPAETVTVADGVELVIQPLRTATPAEITQMTDTLDANGQRLQVGDKVMRPGGTLEYTVQTLVKPGDAEKIISMSTVGASGFENVLRVHCDSVIRKKFTLASVINRDFKLLAEKYGTKWAIGYFDQVNVLLNPTQNEIVEYRYAGPVTKEGDRYLLHPVYDTDTNKWQLVEPIDVTDQFTETPNPPTTYVEVVKEQCRDGSQIIFCKPAATFTKEVTAQEFVAGIPNAAEIGVTVKNVGGSDVISIDLTKTPEPAHTTPAPRLDGEVADDALDVPLPDYIREFIGRDWTGRAEMHDTRNGNIVFIKKMDNGEWKVTDAKDSTKTDTVQDLSLAKVWARNHLAKLADPQAEKDRISAMLKANRDRAAAEAKTPETEPKPGYIAGLITPTGRYIRPQDYLVGPCTATEARGRVQKLDMWTIEQGIIEAKARGDDWNVDQWTGRKNNAKIRKAPGIGVLTSGEREGLNEYLFSGEYPQWYANKPHEEVWSGKPGEPFGLPKKKPPVEIWTMNAAEKLIAEVKALDLTSLSDDAIQAWGKEIDVHKRSLRRIVFDERTPENETRLGQLIEGLKARGFEMRVEIKRRINEENVIAVEIPAEFAPRLAAMEDAKLERRRTELAKEIKQQRDLNDHAYDQMINDQGASLASLRARIYDLRKQDRVIEMEQQRRAAEAAAAIQPQPEVVAEPPLDVAELRKAAFGTWGWEQEYSDFFLKLIAETHRDGKPIPVLFACAPNGLPSIHSWKKEDGVVEHMGFGCFYTKSPDFYAVWDAGGAMSHHGKISYTTVNVEKGEMPAWYNVDAVRLTLLKFKDQAAHFDRLAEEQQAAALAAAAPAPVVEQPAEVLQAPAATKGPIMEIMPVGVGDQLTAEGMSMLVDPVSKPPARPYDPGRVDLLFGLGPLANPKKIVNLGNAFEFNMPAERREGYSKVTDTLMALYVDLVNPYHKLRTVARSPIGYTGAQGIIGYENDVDPSATDNSYVDEKTGLIHSAYFLTWRANLEGFWRIHITYEYGPDTYTARLWRALDPATSHLVGEVVDEADGLMWEDLRDVTDQMYDRAKNEYCGGFMPDKPMWTPKLNPDIPTVSSRPKIRH